MPDIVTVGECLVEFFSEKNLIEADTVRRSWGGDAPTVLLAASRLGSSTGLITRLGGDPFGTYLLETLQAEGIDISQVHVTPGGFTGLYFISLVEDGAKDFLYYRQGSAAGSLGRGDLDRDYIAQAKIFHASGITQAISQSGREATLAAASMAKEMGVQVSYDPNFRSRLTGVLKAEAAFKEIVPFVDIVLASHPEETGQLLSSAEPELAIEYLWERGVPLVVVKLGENGCLVGHEGKMTPVGPHKAGYVADATGAGDVFDGAFLHSLTHGASPVESARIAAAMAALKCRGRGSIASVPGRADVEAAMGHSIPQAMKAKLIVNPWAGSGSAGRRWPRVSAILHAEGFLFDHVMTEQRGHAQALAREASVAGYDLIVSVGELIGAGSATFRVLPSLLKLRL